MAKQLSRAKRLSNALSKIEEGKADIEELRDEIESWKSGLEGTNLENSAKYSELEDCYDTLDQGINDIECATSDLEDVCFPGMF